MQSIIEVLRFGSGRDRLAVVADILSIFGVSIAAVVGGVLTLSTTLSVGNVIAAAAISLVSLAGITLVLIVFFAASGWVSRNSSYARLLRLALWATFAALLLFAIFAWYEFMSSVRFSR